MASEKIVTRKKNIIEEAPSISLSRSRRSTINHKVTPTHKPAPEVKNKFQRLKERVNSVKSKAIEN
jgi:hypothetical protein